MRFLYSAPRKDNINQNLNVKGINLYYENLKILNFTALKGMILEDDTLLYVYSYS
jgi:hypothetical protein